MEFRVNLTELAIADLSEYTEFIRDVKESPEAAEKWFRGVLAEIYSLEQQPERCPWISESHSLGRTLRQLIYFSHRIVFAVDQERRAVTVYRVYHAARRRLRAEDIAPYE